MKSGWTDIHLGDVCELRYGKSLPKSNRSGTGFYVYGSNGQVGKHAEAITAGPTIIIGRKGSFGEVSFSSDRCWPIDTTYYIDESVTDADLCWLYYRMKAMPLTQLNRAAAVPGLNREDAYAQTILLPPLEEQRRIAALLDAAEALRAKRQQALKMLDFLAKAIFLDMFGNSVKNERGWPKYYLSDVATIDRRSLSPSEIRSDEQYVGLENITSRGAFEGVDTADKANLKSNKFIFNTDHILYGKLRPYLTKIAAPEFEGICSTDILPVKPGSNLNRHYLLYYLRSPGIVKYATNNAVGINLPRLSPKVLESFEIPLPPIKEQEKFSFALELLTDLMDLMNIYVDDLDTLFASLQQRAFRGEL